MDEIKEKTVIVKTPYSDEEIKDYTEKVLKNDTEIMKEQNKYLEAFLSEIGKLTVDFFPYSLEEKLIDLELIEDKQLLLDLHKEIHKYIKYLEQIVEYAIGTRYLQDWETKREMKALNNNHMRISMRVRELRNKEYDGD